MSSPVLEVSHLHRRFESVYAVRDVSFTIHPGQVVGFIGENGAGKTTTMRMAATLDVPDRGEIRIGGLDPAADLTGARRALGWMPDHFGTYEHMTVREYLDFFARAYGFTGAERRSRIDSVMEFTELTHLADRPSDALSKGMGQRLCLGRALLNDPALLILDEPAAGLDPKARIDFKHLVRVLAKEGKALLISSHILSELEDICDSMLFINQGVLLHEGTTEALRNQSDGIQIVDIRVTGDPGLLESAVHLAPGTRVLEAIKGGFRVEIEGGAPELRHRLLRRLVQEGIEVIDFHLHQRRLEDAFVDILSRDRNQRKP